MADIDYRVSKPCPVDPRMDPRRFNEIPRGRESQINNPQRSKKEDVSSWKMLKDPCIHKCENKIVRFDGKPLEGHAPVDLKDPRRFPDFIDRQLAFSQFDISLPVPNLKEDDCYIGPLLKREITISNLNNNIDIKFLNNMVRDYKTVASKIYFHPSNGKHLGIAKIVFSLLYEAEDFINRFDGKSQMGNKIQVMFDPKGKIRQSLVAGKLNNTFSNREILQTSQSISNSNKSPISKDIIQNPERRLPFSTNDALLKLDVTVRDPRRNSTDSRDESRHSSYRYHESKDHRINNIKNNNRSSYSYDSRKRDRHYHSHDNNLLERSYERHNSFNELLPSKSEHTGHTKDNRTRNRDFKEVDVPQDNASNNGQSVTHKNEDDSYDRTGSLDSRINMLLGMHSEGQPGNDHDETLNIEQNVFEEEVQTTVEESLCQDVVNASDDFQNKCDNLDDHMSLSSLSSDDEKIKINYNFEAKTKINNIEHYVSVWDHDSEKRSLKECLETTINHLRNVLHSDVFRKTLQIYAFEVFEKWLTESRKPNKKYEYDKNITDSRHKDKKFDNNEENEKNYFPKPQLLTSENLFDNIASGGYLGLRAGMPKMRSFKVPKKPLTPPLKRSPSSKKDVISNSDDDCDVSDDDFMPNSNIVEKHKIKYSSSSSCSGNETTLSSSGSEDENNDNTARFSCDDISSICSKISDTDIEIDTEVDITKIRGQLKDNDVKINKKSLIEKANSNILTKNSRRGRKPRTLSTRGRGRGRHATPDFVKSTTNMKEDNEMDTEYILSDIDDKENKPTMTVPCASTSTNEDIESKKMIKTFSEQDAVMTLLQMSKTATKGLDDCDKSIDNSSVDAQSVITEHNYFNLANPNPTDLESNMKPEELKLESSLTKAAEIQYIFLHDHCYSLPYATEDSSVNNNAQIVKMIKTPQKLKSTVKKTTKPLKLSLSVKPILFKKRSSETERALLIEALTIGLDSEDIRYMKRSYDQMVVTGDLKKTLQATHWADVSPNLELPTKKRRRHLREGICSRGQSFELMAEFRKKKYANDVPQKRSSGLRSARLTNATSSLVDRIAVQSRGARLENRRHLTVLGECEFDSDLFKFNQLKTRRKRLKFDKSSIHSWGLFAKEPIQSEEMVIEYIGEAIRSSIADYREKKYTKEGIGSSYLFRLDTEMVIDATKKGNLARFINHSCNPNCYAKVVTVESYKKIVIYSKYNIDVGEEITYDYKFPYDDDKIVCHCATPQFSQQQTIPSYQKAANPFMNNQQNMNFNWNYTPAPLNNSSANPFMQNTNPSQHKTNSTNPFL